MSEDSAELPEGWAKATFREVCRKVLDGTHHSPKDQSSIGAFKYITAKNIKLEGVDLRNISYVPSHTHDAIFSRCDPEKGDVLYIKDGATTGIATVNQLDEPFSLLSSVALLKPHRGCLDAFFLKWYLNSPIGFKAMTDQMTGSAITRLTLDIIRNSTIPIPPLLEQRRIVAAVERILAKVSSARERLERVPRTMKRFRQAVLASACSGRLTGDWRGRDGDTAHQPEAEMPEIPSSWGYEPARDVVEKGTVISYGMVLPGRNLAEGVPYVRGQDINDSGEILINQLWRTDPAIAAKHKRSELRHGDVLLCVIRHLRVALVPSGIDGANLTQGTVRLRPSENVAGPYLALFLASTQAQSWMKSRYIGMAMPRINVEHARGIPIALPPLPEQHEIVRRVSALFALADSLERRAKSALRRVEALTQSVLAKAFRGELVPTEAELARRENRGYESAGELLARLRSAGDAAAKGRKMNQPRRGGSR